MKLINLPPDIIYDVFLRLHVHDILALERVCLLSGSFILSILLIFRIDNPATRHAQRFVQFLPQGICGSIF